MKFVIKFLLAWALVVACVDAQAANLWQARHRMTAAEFQTTFNQLVSEGYRLNYASGYTINNEPRFAAIWEKRSTPAWAARFGMTSTEYQNEFNKYVGQGYRLILVNGYTVGGDDRYIAIWDKSPAPKAWEARHGLTAIDLQTTFDRLVADGYRLKHVSGYAVGNTPRFAAIWELPFTNDGIPWISLTGLSSANYQLQTDTLVAQGYRTVYVNGYGIGNVDFYGAIWDKTTVPGWVTRHGLTSDQYQQEFNKWVEMGYTLEVVSGYTVNNADRYAALWIKH